MYYYIVNKKRIVGFEQEVNLAMNGGFAPLTKEQSEFYEKNPNTTINEVLQCKLNERYVPEVKVGDSIPDKLKELRNVCNDIISVSYLDYALAISCLDEKSPYYTGEKFYSEKDAQAVIKRFMDEGTLARRTYDKYATRIEAAKSVENMDSIITQAKKELNNDNSK